MPRNRDAEIVRNSDPQPPPPEEPAPGYGGSGGGGGGGCAQFFLGPIFLFALWRMLV